MRKKDQETKEEGHIFTIGCAVMFRIKPVILGKNDLGTNDAVYNWQTGFEWLKKQLCGEENLDRALRL